MAADNKTGTNRKIIDVAGPDTSAAEPSARPILVTNRPIMKDPMVVEKEKNNEENEELASNTTKKLATGSSKSRIEPLSAPTIPEETKSTEAESKIDEPKNSDEEKPKTDDTESAEVTKSQDEQEPPKKDREEPKNTESTESDTGPSEDQEPSKPESKSPEQKETEEAVKKAEHEAAIQKIVDSKKYYVPVNTVEKRRSKRFVALGALLSLFLIIAWLDVALDAGLVNLSTNLPHTHFFSISGTTTPTAATPSVNTAVFAASQKYIKAIQNKDKTVADSLETPAAKAAFLKQNGAASFYDTCQSTGQICTAFFVPAFVNKTVKTYKAYTAQDGTKGQEIIYTQKTKSGSSTCPSTSTTTLTMDLVPSGHTWLVDNIVPNTDVSLNTC
jgi:hypothetical protein